MKRKVVITGMGAITPIGNNVEEFWRNLLAGRSGVGPITLFDPSDYPVKIAAEVKDFNGGDYFDRKDLRMMARPAQFGVASALMALEDAQWEQRPGEDPLGVVCGISNCAQDVLVPAYETVMKGNHRQVSPNVLNKCFPHSTASEISRLTGFQDQVTTLSTGCTSGLNSIGYALDAINEARARSILCASTDATITEHAFAFFCRSGMLSRNEINPDKVSRPFDAERDGGVLGEGAGAFFIETLDQACKRNVRVLAEISGFASSGRGYSFNNVQENITTGMCTAMQNALLAANVNPDQIDYIGCHGVSDPNLDLCETIAIKRVFGERAYRLPISSIKSMIGIPQNAAGHLQAIATIKALNEGILSPTINYDNPDPQCDLDYVPNHPRRNCINLAMVFGHGFNGSDTAIVLRSNSC